MIILEKEDETIRERALALFAGKARRAVRLRGEINIRVTSNREMRELNRRFRKQNKPTDVLSFPSELPKLAGDIAISVEIAAVNASRLGHSTETELKILILHGLLHLAGYDHETDRGEMRAREAKLRQQLKLPVGLTERTHGAIGTRAPRRRKSVAPPKRGGLRQ